MAFTGFLEGSKAGNPRPRMWWGGTPHLVSREGIPHNHLPILEREETTVQEWAPASAFLPEMAQKSMEHRVLMGSKGGS